MEALNLSRTLLAAIALAGIGLAAIPAAKAASAAWPQTVHISAKLTVTHTAPPVCHAGSASSTTTAQGP
jgi:hypothetical protein